MNPSPRRSGRAVGRQCVLVVAVFLAATPLLAQDRGRRRFQFLPPSSDNTDFSVNNVPYDGRLTFVRMRFTPSFTSYGQGGGYFGGINYWWDHDYPRADQHVMTIIDELTSLKAYLEGTNIFAATDPEFFRYPIAYLSEPGYWVVGDEEATSLRAYLLKGGFLIVDDMSGRHLLNLMEQLRKVLPDTRLQRLDVTHPIFHSFFEIENLSFLPSYRGYAPEFYGAFEDNDPNKRLMIIVNHNNDIGEFWEWSDTGFISIPLTNEAYKIGVNYFVYSMSH